MDQQRITQIYERLRSTQPTFVETDNEWIAKGLSSTPFKALVSVAISTMTTEKELLKLVQLFMTRSLPPTITST